MSGWMIAAAVVMVVAGAAEAKQQREAGKANEQIAQNNERMALDQAHDANIQGARESQQAVWRQRAVRGAQIASMAAQGIDSSSGNAADLLDETAMFGAADRKAIGINAERNAWGFGGEATNYHNQGKQARWAGNEGSKLTILSTIGNAMSMGAGAAGGAKTTKQPAANAATYQAPATRSYRYGPPG